MHEFALHQALLLLACNSVSPINTLLDLGCHEGFQDLPSMGRKWKSNSKVLGCIDNTGPNSQSSTIQSRPVNYWTSRPTREKTPGNNGDIDELGQVLEPIGKPFRVDQSAWSFHRAVQHNISVSLLTQGPQNKTIDNTKIYKVSRLQLGTIEVQHTSSSFLAKCHPWCSRNSWHVRQSQLEVALVHQIGVSKMPKGQAMAST